MNFLLSLSASERVDERQPLRDLVPTGVVPRVGQLLVAVQRRLPALELGLQEGAVRPSSPSGPISANRSLPRLRAFWIALGSEVSRLRTTILRRFAGVVIASYTLSMGNKVESIIRLISLKTTSRARSSSTSSSGQP